MRVRLTPPSPAALPAGLCHGGCRLPTFAHPAPCDQTGCPGTGAACALPVWAQWDQGTSVSAAWLCKATPELSVPSAPPARAARSLPPHSGYWTPTRCHNALFRWLLALTSPLPTLRTFSEGAAYTSDFHSYLALPRTRQTLQCLVYLFLVKHILFLSTKDLFQQLPT